jgi:hypothetical protein
MSPGAAEDSNRSTAGEMLLRSRQVRPTSGVAYGRVQGLWTRRQRDVGRPMSSVDMP